MLIVVTSAVLERDASGHDDFARAGGLHAGAGCNRAGGFHAGTGLNRAGGFHAGTGLNRAGGFHAGAGNDHFTARRFNPPPSLVGFFVNPLRNTFTNAIRIHGVALAGSHVSQTRIVAVLIVATLAVHELDALRNDNSAGAGCN